MLGDIYAMKKNKAISQGLDSTGEGNSRSYDKGLSKEVI